MYNRMYNRIFDYTYYTYCTYDYTFSYVLKNNELTSKMYDMYNMYNHFEELLFH